MVSCEEKFIAHVLTSDVSDQDFKALLMNKKINKNTHKKGNNKEDTRLEHFTVVYLEKPQHEEQIIVRSHNNVA